MGKLHDRISDTNRRRKLQFGQATMLGITFEDKRYSGSEYSHPRWTFTIPPQLPRVKPITHGYYSRRWECVEAALRVLGVAK